MSILLVEVWCWKEDGGGTAPGHQSGGGSAVLTDDFRCHHFPGSEAEGGEPEGCREAPIPQGTTSSLGSILLGGLGNEVQRPLETSLQPGRATPCLAAGLPTALSCRLG